MKLVKPVQDIKTVYVRAESKDRTTGASLTLYDTTPEAVIDLLKQSANPNDDSSVTTCPASSPSDADTHRSESDE